MDVTHAAEDNRKNTRDELVKNTLDSVMATQEQSYEEFVKGFTFFKSDSGGMKMKKPEMKLLKESVKGNSENKVPKHQIRSANLPGPKVTSQKKVTIPDNDYIEEEVLQEGSSGSRLNASKSIRTGTSVKFDNFISSHDDDDDDGSADVPVDIDTDVDRGGYTASFLGPASSVRETEPLPVRPQEPSQTAVSKNQKSQDQSKTAVSKRESTRQPAQSPDVTELFDGLSVEESQTDKLLMNFLADLQNEMNEKQPLTTEPVGGSGDIQAFLDRQTKEQANEVNFSDDESEDVLALCTDSTEKSMKIVVDSNELRPAVAKYSVKNDDVSRDVLMDSEGNRTISVDEVNTYSSTSSDQQEIETGKVVFPGEVENAEKEVEATVKCSNERLLDFKAIYAPHNSQLTDEETPGRTVTTSATTTTTTRIETFQLDEAFDYDYVVLAPKFSVVEVDQLRGRQIEQPATV